MSQSSYYSKYLKYKTKYLLLKGAGTHDCHPTNKYSDICIPSNTGHYNTKQSCINDCETKYINHHLITANLKRETSQFYQFIKDLIKNEHARVFIKGGNVIGLYLLKMISKEPNFEDLFNKFLKLELIKDWDFMAFTKNPISTQYRSSLDAKAANYRLVPRAKTFILYQAKRPILIHGTALFEIAILDSDNYAKLEVPMTTMKIRVNEYNLKYIFMLAKTFLSKEYDHGFIKKILSTLTIITHPHKRGFYNPGKDFDTGGLSKEMIEFINDFANHDKGISQFLVIHLQDPFRMLYRLPEKNIPKSERIKEFIRANMLKGEPDWLLDKEVIEGLVERFAKELGEKIKGAGDIGVFLKGINFNRIMLEYNNLSDRNKELLGIMFGGLVGKSDEGGTGGLDKFIGFMEKIGVRG